MRIGIDIGGSHIGVGLIDGSKIVDTIDVNLTRDDRHDMFDSILRICSSSINELILRNSIDIKDIDIIGIAAPGDIKDNIIVKSDNLELYDCDIASKIGDIFGLPVQVRNDAKCAGLAEIKYGSMKGYSDCAFLTLGTGIGGAVFLDGKLLKNGAGFEIGHMIINKGGRQCTCGKRGCFETYASIRAFKNKVAEVLDIDSDFSGQYLRENLLDFDNVKVREVIDQFIDDLIVGISNIIDIFVPEVVCLGGSFSYYEGHRVFNELLSRIEEKGRVRCSKLPKIVLAELKNDAGIIGATI
ncbi:MAG: ROK family protein [Clostridia bacterium]|nr:ROK family protein [Clostridia bacterium]